VRDGSPLTLETSFEVVDEAGFEALFRYLTTSLAGVDPVLRQVAAIRDLADAGLFSDSYRAAARLLREHPGKALPVRLMLDALERLGLAGSPLFCRLCEEHGRVRRESEDLR
jgi:hypothetical protein